MEELLIILALWLFSSKRGGQPVRPTGPTVEPTRPTNGPTPTDPTPGAPGAGGGRVWGSGTIPAGWDPRANQIYIAPDCSLVLEGDGFEPRSQGSFNIGAIEESTLVDALAIPTNSVYGYIDWLLVNTGLQSAEQIALEVASQANALCADVPASQRHPAFAQWLASFTERIRGWIEEPTIGFGE